ncbi:MAG: response regulator [Candidatus Zixiibacteriota bacterium]
MNILFAEDDAVSRKLVESYLNKWGHTAFLAEDGQQAIEIFDANPYIHLAILDWMMPNVDGVEVCRRLKKHPSQRCIYVVMLTAKAANEDIVQALDAGADDFMSKPFNQNELRARIAAGERIMNLETELVEYIEKLESALTQVKRLQGIIPICSWCKSIRTDKNFWTSFEEYLSDYGQHSFTHGICPDCMKKYYPDLVKAGADPE